MSRYMCCGLCRSSGRKRFDSDLSEDSQDEIHTNFDDLMLHPNKIDSNLDQRISEWQDAINDYKLYEDNYLELDDKNDNLRNIIKDLRKNPEQFISDKYTVHVIKLAEKKLVVNNLQSKLGITKAMIAEQVSSKADDDLSDFDPKSETTLTKSDKYNSTKLSVMWANRLNEINPTQGSLPMNETIDKNGSTTTSNNRLISTDMKIRPKWPDFLIDTSYDVVKVNRVGHKMRRTLKLTQNHVIGIKHGCVISKFFHFNEIRRVWLENGNTIHVQQRNNHHNIYMSPIAAHILQQLTTRVQVRASLDKTEFKGFSSQSIGFSSAATISIIKNIAEENTLETEAVMQTFANDLKDRTIRTLSMDMPGRDSITGRSDSMSLRTDSNSQQSSQTEALVNAANSEGVTHHDATESEQMVDLDQLRDDTVVPTELPSSTEHQPSDSNNETDLDADIIMSDIDKCIANAVRNVAKLSGQQLTEEEVVVPIADDTTDSMPVTTKERVNSQDEPTLKVVEEENKIRAQKMHSSASITSKGGNNPRFLNFKEGMPEYAAQSAVQNIIFDASTNEGNTRKLFIEKFIANNSSRRESTNSGVINISSVQSTGPKIPSPSECKARLLEIRLFIDGMHEYILAHRGISLSILYEQQKQRAIINGLSNDNDTADEMSESDHILDTLTSVANNQLGSARNSSKAAKQRQIVRRASLKFVKENMDLSIVEESILVFISFIIFIVVEEALFLPLKNQIIALLPNGGRMDDEIALVAKMKAFVPRTQQQWGVPNDLVSPLGWQSAIFELAGVEHNLTPSSQLHILTRTVKAIYTEFKLVVLPRLQAIGKHDVYIGADDLVPIFMYVFCQSDLRHPIRNRDLMWSLCHPDQLHGEGGYYLTVYESSIEFIQNEPLNEEDNEFIEKNNSTKPFQQSATSNPLHTPSAAGLNTNSKTKSERGQSSVQSFDDISLSDSYRSDYSDNSHTPRDRFLHKLSSRLGLNGWFGRNGDMKESPDYAMRESFY